VGLQALSSFVCELTVSLLGLAISALCSIKRLGNACSRFVLNEDLGDPVGVPPLPELPGSHTVVDGALGHTEQCGRLTLANPVAHPAPLPNLRKPS
jgi:hypothetical protein